MKIDYVAVTKEEIADGVYGYSIIAFDDHDCEVDEYSMMESIVEASEFAETLAEKHGAIVDYDIAASDYATLAYYE